MLQTGGQDGSPASVGAHGPQPSLQLPVTGGLGRAPPLDPRLREQPCGPLRPDGEGARSLIGLRSFIHLFLALFLTKVAL